MILRERFGPFGGTPRSFTPTLCHEGQPVAGYSAACRSCVSSRTCHFLYLDLSVETVWAFIPCGTNTPSADFCRPSGWITPPSVPIPGPNDRSPEVSSTVFGAQPPEFTFCALDGYGLCDLTPARPALTPRIRFLYIGSRLCSTLLSDPASRRRPCALLTLHLHQVG